MKKPRFRIGSSADTAYELKKTLERQLLYAGSLYAPLQPHVGEVIHETRQIYKKCRAILRLMRDAMGYESYSRANISLRDMQRDLSRIRDADVQLQLFTDLSERFPEYKSYSWFKRIIDAAKKTHDQELRHFLESDKASEISRQIATQAAQSQHYELIGEEFEIIEGGLRRIYRQGREMGTVVFGEDVAASEIHTFRKRAKYLQYQLTYLRSISNELIKAMSTTLEQLTEHLGYYNDLHLANTSIEEVSDRSEVSQQKRAMLQSSLRELMQSAKSRSELIYTNLYIEKPAQFIRRIRTFWTTYRKNQNEKI
jgi:CHAD domain-containing protein